VENHDGDAMKNVWPVEEEVKRLKQRFTDPRQVALARLNLRVGIKFLMVHRW
jgi:hypothetical protein